MSPGTISSAHGSAPMTRSDVGSRVAPSGSGRRARQAVEPAAPRIPTTVTIRPTRSKFIWMQPLPNEHAAPRPSASRSTGKARMTSIVRDSAVSIPPRK